MTKPRKRPRDLGVVNPSSGRFSRAREAGRPSAPALALERPTSSPRWEMGGMGMAAAAAPAVSYRAIATEGRSIDPR